MSETGDRDSDGFPVATAENYGSTYTDDENVTWVCDELTSEERAEIADDLELDGAEYVWRIMGKAR